MMEFLNISHTYLSPSSGTIQALRDITLTVRKGELLCLLGPSGCGKSTLINIAAGFITPSQGEARLDGERIMKPGRKTAMVFQESSLLPWMSVEENLLLALDETGADRRPRRSPTIPEKERIREVLTLVGLRGFDTAMPHELSGGMKQKVSIARCLLMDSSILLMDEPFSSLDEQTRSRLNHDLVEIWREKESTILFVTHSIQEAIRIGTRIVLLSARPGRIVDQWDTSGAGPDITDPRFVTVYNEVRESMELCCPPDGYQTADGDDCDCREK